MPLFLEEGLTPDACLSRSFLTGTGLNLVPEVRELDLLPPPAFEDLDPALEPLLDSDLYTG